nr:myosin:SUBUNIT=essential light chain [Macrocallista nimbosa]
SGLSESEIEDAREVFDLFDFWDGRDGEVDAFKLGDLLLRCLGHNPTNAIVSKHGTEKMGEKSYKFEEFIPLYKELMNEKDTGTFADFMEAFKTFDREGQGFISGAELRHLLTSLGEKLTDMECDDILRYIDLTEDLEGNVKYEECINKVMAGPN